MSITETALLPERLEPRQCDMARRDMVGTLIAMGMGSGANESIECRAVGRLAIVDMETREI